MFKKIKFVFKTIYIITEEYFKYLCKKICKIQNDRIYNDLIINISNKLSKENIFYLKLIQGLSSNLYNLNSELIDYFEKYTNNVEYCEEDIDSYLLDSISNMQNKKLIFDNKPINSGIISIIFKGYYEDKKVVIKLKRKNVLNKLIDSLDNIEFFIKFLEFFPKVKNLNLLNVFKENKDLLIEQTNFLNEINNMKSFYNRFNKIDYVIIPFVYEDYTLFNENIIVMDYIEGKHINKIMDDSIRDAYALMITKSVLRSIMFDGLFHGDLHAGNILFMEEDNKLKIGIIDFGIIGRISNDFKDSFINFLSHISDNDCVNSSKILLEDLTEPSGYYNNLDTKIKNIIINKIYLVFKNTVFTSKTIKQNDIIKINILLNKYKMQLSKQFCRMQMALAIAENLTYMLSGSKNYSEHFDIALEELLVG